jgi:hypothetical protein
MRRPTPLPSHLADRAFHRDEAIASGISARMLEHPRFVEVFPRVYRTGDVVLTPDALIAAARLTLPADAVLSHLTRFVPLGLDLGPLLPLRFTVGRDHHLTFDRIFLRRTVSLPPHRDGSLEPEGALLLAAAELVPVEVVMVADWLLHRGHLRLDRLRSLVHEQRWRTADGLVEELLPWMDGRAASLPESRLRCLLVAAGLPSPEVNADVHDASGRFLARGDLVYRWWRLVVEFEGRQHALDAQQFQRDLHRYRGLREDSWDYVQVTSSMLAHPRTTVLLIHRALVRAGYDGPPPTFGARWEAMLAAPLVQLGGGFSPF